VKRIYDAKGKKTLHLCEMETKTKSNRFKMYKSVHKSKPQQDFWQKTHVRRSRWPAERGGQLAEKRNNVVSRRCCALWKGGRQVYVSPTSSNVRLVGEPTLRDVERVTNRR